MSFNSAGESLHERIVPSGSLNYGSNAPTAETSFHDQPIPVKGALNETSVAVSPVSETSARLTLRQRLTSPEYIRMINFALMCMVLFGYGLGISLFAPFFPTEAEKRGVSEPVVGLIFASYTFFMFIGMPINGVLVKHLGLYFMIGAGIFLAGGATFLFGFLAYIPVIYLDAYVVLCFAIRIIEGCGTSMYMTASFSIASTLYPKNISFVYAILEMATNVGRTVGPSVGGGLFTAGGFSLPFIVIGLMIVMFGFISMIVLKVTASTLASVEEQAQTSNSKTEKPLSWLHFYRTSPSAWILSLVQFLICLLYSFPEPTLSLYFSQLGLTDPASVGFVFLGSSLAFSVVCVFIGKAADKFPKYTYWMLGIAGLIEIFAMLIIGPTPLVQSWMPPSIPLTVAGTICIDIGVAFVLSPIPQALSTAIYAAGYPDTLETNSLIASIYNGMWYAGGTAGPALAGALMDAIGFPNAATVMAGFAVILLSAVIAGEVLNRHKKTNQFNHSPLDDETPSPSQNNNDSSLDNQCNDIVPQ